MVNVDITDDISGLEVISEAEAERRVHSNNDDREEQAQMANYGRDVDDFRYNRPGVLPKQFILRTTRYGNFIASIEGSDGKELYYHLHAKIV